MGREGEVLAALLAVVAIIIAPRIDQPPLIGLFVIAGSIALYFAFRTRFVTITLGVLAALYGMSLLPLFIFACTVVIIIAGELVFSSLGNKPASFFWYVVSAAVAGAVAMFYTGVVSPLTLVIGVNVAVLLKAVVGERQDALLLEALGIAASMLLFQLLNYHANSQLLVVAVLIASAFAYFSYRTKTADISGLFSGALVGILLIVFADVTWFLIMLLFFILGSAATRYRYLEKVRIGVEQSHGGARGYINVFSNGIVGAVSAVLFGVTGSPLFAALFVGSVATAAADTVAGEIGVTGGSPYLITSLKKVPAGTNGAVSLLGEAAGLVSAAVICSFAWALHVLTPEAAVICTIAGFIGSNLDSLVGDMIENRGLIGNAGTNFLSTLGGGVLALVLTGLL